MSHRRRACTLDERCTIVSMRGAAALVSLNLLASAAGLSQETGIAVGGRVADPEGSPLANARVELRPVPGRYEGGLREAMGEDPAPVQARGVTGPDGRFVLRAPAAGMWRVVVAAEGYVPYHHPLLPVLEDTELLPVKLPMDAGLRLQVLSRDGAPIARARVAGEVRSRFPAPSSGGWEPVERAGTTGADGIVRLPKAAAETLLLRLIAAGFPPQDGPETNADAAVARLVPGLPAMVEVQEWRARTPAVAVVRDLSGRFVLGRTDRDGRFAVDLPLSGELRVMVETSDGRRIPLQSKLAAELAPHRLQSFSLPTGGSVTGRVIDRETRRPLSDALVWPESDPGRWVRTDADGVYRLQGITVPSDLGVAAAAAGHLPGSISLQGSLPRQPPVLALAPAAALSGTVVDARGRPLANAAVKVSRLGGEAVGEEAHAARTSTEGLFRVPGLRTGASYAVTAALAGFSPASTSVAMPKPGAPFPALRLILGRGRRAFGRVVDSGGLPVAGARVELTPGSTGRVAAAEPETGETAFRTSTRPDGRFELRHLPAGWFRLRIQAGGFLLLEQPGLEIPAAAAPADLGRFLLQRGSVFQGQVVNPEGEPLPDAEVWVIPTPVRDWADLYAEGPAAVTGADGSFLVRDLPLEGSFGLDVCRAGYLPLSAIVREVGQEPFRAVLRPAARISGRVTAADGGPVPAARIESWLAGEEPARAESLRPCRRGAGAATADSEGRFRLDGLPPGWWSLRAAADGHLSAMRERLHVLAGDSLEDVEIVLGRGAVVSGRVFTADGEPAAGARVSSFAEAGTVETLAGGDGAYRLTGVEPGERTVEATLGDGVWASQSLTVGAGDNRLDLTMDQGSRRQEIRGRVSAPDGSPIAGAGVFAASSARTFSAADGSFALAVEDGQVYEVWAEKERFAAAKAGAAVRVAGAPVEGVEIQLGRGGSLGGRLLGLDREELARASVEVELTPPFLARAAVDPQGSYRLEDVPPGEWTVTARAGDRTVRERAVLPPDASDATVDLAFAPSHEVSGWVSGPDGEPIDGAFIRLFASGGSSGSTYSRSDGGFRLRLEDGTYRVVARREGYLWTLQDEPAVIEGGPVSGLELRLDKAAVIRGQILGLDPGERAKAVWVSAPGRNGGRREGQLDQEGGFVIHDVPPGDWKVTVIHGEREAGAPVQLDAGQEEWVEVEIDRP